MPATRPRTLIEPEKQPNSQQLAERKVARSMMDGTANVVIAAAYLPGIHQDVSPQTLAALLNDQVQAISSGDLSQLEKLLLSQAIALQSMFVDLASKAREQTTRDNLQVVTSLALKSAAASRQAITALADLRMPKSVMFAKQANVTSGPQQINNGVIPTAGAARAEGFADRQNELLEAQHGQGLDTGTSGTPGRTDPVLAAVGAVDGANVGRR
jgi:hypothetical protein